MRIHWFTLLLFLTAVAFAFKGLCTPAVGWTIVIVIARTIAMLFCIVNKIHKIIIRKIGT